MQILKETEQLLILKMFDSDNIQVIKTSKRIHSLERLMVIHGSMKVRSQRQITVQGSTSGGRLSQKTGTPDLWHGLFLCGKKCAI